MALFQKHHFLCLDVAARSKPVEVNPGCDRVTVIVLAFPRCGVCAGALRLTHQGFHEAPVDIVDGQRDR